MVDVPLEEWLEIEEPLSEDEYNELEAEIMALDADIHDDICVFFTDDLDPVIEEYSPILSVVDKRAPDVMFGDIMGAAVDGGRVPVLVLAPDCTAGLNACQEMAAELTPGVHIEID